MRVRYASLMLGLGFIFSLLTILSLMLLIIAFLAILTYPISVAFRSVGWSLLGRRVYARYLFTGIIIVLLSPLVYAGILFTDNLRALLGLGPGHILALALVAWASYSIVELTSYFSLARYGIKSFYIAMISVVGIIIVILNLPTATERIYDIFTRIYYAFYFLAISSLFASIGSFRIKAVISSE